MAKLTSLLLALTLFSGCSSTPTTFAARREEPLVVFLVRHAEKEEGGRNPVLSTSGEERASRLATTLRNARIEHVHSSDFVRTRETAAPIAAALGLEVELYDPRDLPALVEELQSTGGRHLVVGHSNTTPPLAELLGGEPSSAIDEPSEYDRLYVVTVVEDGAASSVLLRYGEPFVPGVD